MSPNNSFKNWSGVTCYLESDDGQLTPLSREIAASTIQLARQSGAPAYAVIIEGGSDASCVKALAGLSFDRVLVYRSPLYEAYTANTFAKTLVDALNFLRPSVVLIGASDSGKDIAPLAASHYKTGLTADCTGLEILPDGSLLQIRPAFGGNIMAEILTPETRPQFTTVRAGIAAGDRPAAGATSEFIFRPLPESLPNGLPIKVLERRPRQLEPSITEARLIIAVGCGLKLESDIGVARNLASSLGGMLASTRGLVERGWMPPSSQIGLSGQSVSPDLLVTLGVSGSVQFMAGIGGAKYIIAVNNDPAARIFTEAHLGLCCDLYKVLPELAQRIAAE